MENQNQIDAYIASLPKERQTIIKRIQTVMAENMPTGFEESFAYGMLGYSVPFSIYPAGYHTNPTLPVPFIGLASQKNNIAFYHMGLYMNEEVLKWFISEYPKHCKQKLDMGKSCIRFKKMDDIPYGLISELCQKITVDEYLTAYLTTIPKQKLKGK